MNQRQQQKTKQKKEQKKKKGKFFVLRVRKPKKIHFLNFLKTTRGELQRNCFDFFLKLCNLFQEWFKKVQEQQRQPGRIGEMKESFLGCQKSKPIFF